MADSYHDYHSRPGTFDVSCRTPDPNDETVQIVAVENSYRWHLRVEMHVQEWEWEGTTYFSIIELHVVRTWTLDLTSEFLHDDEWWDALIAATLDQLALRSVGFRQALDDGRPEFRYGWDLGPTRKITFEPPGAGEATA